MRVYVSGPYSADDTAANVRTAMQAGADLIDAGHAPYVPHLSFYFDLRHPREYEVWMRVDLAWVQASDAVLRLPGESPGSDREVALAEELGLPIYYSIGELT